MQHSDRSDDHQFGISSFDLGSLSPRTRLVVRVLLRNPDLSATDLLSIYNQIYSDSILELDTLMTIFDELDQAQALAVSDKGDERLYRVHFRRKTMGNRSIWNALEKKRSSGVLESLDLDTLDQHHRPDINPFSATSDPDQE